MFILYDDRGNPILSGDYLYCLTALEIIALNDDVREYIIINLETLNTVSQNQSLSIR